MGSYFYNRDFFGDKVIYYLKEVLFEQSHFPLNPSHRFFKVVYPLFLMRVMFFKMYFHLCFSFSLPKKSFFPFIPSSPNRCGTDTKSSSGGRKKCDKGVQCDCRDSSSKCLLEECENWSSH